jgi:hypothetical protein
MFRPLAHVVGVAVDVKDRSLPDDVRERRAGLFGVDGDRVAVARLHRRDVGVGVAVYPADGDVPGVLEPGRLNLALLPEARLDLCQPPSVPL